MAFRDMSNIVDTVMAEIPADWKDQADPNTLGAILAAARQPTDLTTRMAIGRAHLNEAWRHVLELRQMGNDSNLSELQRDQLKTIMWMMEQVYQ